MKVLNLFALMFLVVATSPSRSSTTAVQATETAQLAAALHEQESGNFDRAIALYREILSQHPKSVEAHNWLGVALAAKSDLLGAIGEFRKAVALDPKYERGWTNLGSALGRSGDIKNAVGAFRKAVEYDPNNPASHMNLAVALRSSGDATGAAEQLRIVLRQHPEDARVHNELGQTLRQAGQIEASIQSFQKAVELDPELREAYYSLGLTLKQSAAGRRFNPRRGPASDACARGRDLSAQGDWKAAQSQLDEALRLDPDSAEVHNLMGYVLGQERDLPEAIRHLKHAVELVPGYAEAHYNYGVALWYNGSREEAVAELKRCLELDPSAGEAYAFLGPALQQTGDLKAAETKLQCAIALLPQLSSVYVDLGNVFLLLHDMPHALGQFESGLNLPETTIPKPNWEPPIDALRKALADNPNNATAHNIVGRMMGRVGTDAGQIAAEFREAIRLKPNYAEAQNNLGLVLAQTDDDDGAIAAFREAVRLSPQWADAHANLGAALAPTDSDSAIKELTRALELDPSSVKARYNLALAYGSNGNYGPDKELEELKKVLATTPDFPRAHVAVGRVLLTQRNLPEAIEHLQRAIQLDSSLGEAHYQLGLALSRAGRKSEAAPELQKGRELVEERERTQNLALDLSEGRAALERGDLDDAKAKFRHALHEEPDSGAANRLLGLALAKQGDTKGGVAALGKALEIDPEDSVASSNLAKLKPPEASGDDPNAINATETYIRQKQFKEAESLLITYLRSRPNSAWGWYALGYSQFAQRLIGDSIRSLAKSLQFDINNAEAHKILGRDLLIVGRFDAARIEFEQGIRLRPDSAELHYNFGKLYSINDEWASARRELAEAVRLDPSYVEGWDALGFAEEALGNGTQAVAAYEKAISLNDACKGRFSAAHVDLSAFYNRTGKPDKALAYARSALNLNPQDDRAWFQMGRAHEHRGELDAAVSSVKHATELNSHAAPYYYVLATLYRRQDKKPEFRQALARFSELDKQSNDLERKRRDASADSVHPDPALERIASEIRE